VAQRLVRAKRKIAQAHIPFRAPTTAEMPARLDDVLRVLLLLFTQGHRAPQQTAARAEAIRLARLVAELLPDEPEAIALVALLLFVDARQTTRVDTAGTIVTLDHQDRTRWDDARINEADALLDRAMTLRRPGPMQLQAAIAALHSTAATPGDTDWRQIALLYDELLRYEPSPLVEANKAIAVAMAEGPAAGLVILDVLATEPHLAGWPGFHMARADLLSRLDRADQAIAAYRTAVELEPCEPERRYIVRRIRELERAKRGHIG
jgi:RNA polymerase sigma-70 factor (ECF subfamily)